MYVTYSNSEEAIVCLDVTEEETIRTYFTEGGRDLDDYDRKTVKEEAVLVSTRIEVE